jgi:hypothetical protein
MVGWGTLLPLVGLHGKIRGGSELRGKGKEKEKVDGKHHFAKIQVNFK